MTDTKENLVIDETGVQISNEPNKKNRKAKPTETLFRNIGDKTDSTDNTAIKENRKSQANVEKQLNSRSGSKTDKNGKSEVTDGQVHKVMDKNSHSNNASTKKDTGKVISTMFGKIREKPNSDPVDENPPKTNLNEIKEGEELEKNVQSKPEAPDTENKKTEDKNEISPPESNEPQNLPDKEISKAPKKSNQQPKIRSNKITLFFFVNGLPDVEPEQVTLRLNSVRKIIRKSLDDQFEYNGCLICNVDGIMIYSLSQIGSTMPVILVRRAESFRPAPYQSKFNEIMRQMKDIKEEGERKIRSWELK